MSYIAIYTCFGSIRVAEIGRNWCESVCRCCQTFSDMKLIVAPIDVFKIILRYYSMYSAPVVHTEVAVECVRIVMLARVQRRYFANVMKPKSLQAYKKVEQG